jgi:fructokinase
MKQKEHVQTPLALGMGLLALDVVISESESEPIRHRAGGTCGNVLLALRYLNWQTAPIARLQQGPATTRLLDDLHYWNVDTDHITEDESGSTPVIVQRIGRTRTGEPRHSFSWRCPNCGNRLPGYKPVLMSEVENMVAKLDTVQVFFFDRVSRGALMCAQACSELGAVIAFEPSGIGHPALFEEAWALAHIVKYSHERLHELPTKLERLRGPRLQIETLGQDGLRYRSSFDNSKTRGWQHLDALEADVVRDTAGAGDWCTAGVLSKLARRGVKGLPRMTDGTLREAIRYGQALAAWNCRFEGARGGMYSVTKDVFFNQVTGILRGSDAKRGGQGTQTATAPLPFDCLCPSCQSAGKTHRARVRATAQKY